MDSATNFLEFKKKNNFSRPTVQKLQPIDFFPKILAILAKKTLLKYANMYNIENIKDFYAVFLHIFFKKIFESKAMHFSSISIS